MTSDLHLSSRSSPVVLRDTALSILISSLSSEFPPLLLVHAHRGAPPVLQAKPLFSPHLGKATDWSGGGKSEGRVKGE